MFPVMLSVQGRRCLVVGGGGVALRKVQSLVDEGARVTVVSPEVVAPLAELAGAGAIVLAARPYAAGEAAGYALVFAATDDREVNRRVFEDAEAAGIWANVADDPELCSFHLPAQLRRGPLHLTLASGGGAPFVVRRLRQLLERMLGAEWGEWMEAAARFRTAVRERGLEPAEQEACFDRFFAGTVDPKRLRARVPTPSDEASWLAPDVDPADGTLEAAAPRSIAPLGQGLVTLVGAGPGCPGLLTVRGRQRLLEADAVVYDRLAAPALPPDLPPEVALHCVGKLPGHHPVPQEEINALLVRLGSEGKRVVRLKGGDPYVFGRGGEEAEALVAAGVPMEVVPGVTSGVAAAAWAGIPVTHRNEAVSVTLLTAHECAKDDGPQVRWDLLARDPHRTLVGYMGVSALPRVVERLLEAGMDPATPAALVERGTTVAQRTVTARVDELVAAGRRNGIRPPALFVIGPTVRHAARLGWWAQLPLAGQRLLLVKEADGLGRPLESAGAEVLRVALPLSPAARVAMAALPLSGVVVASAAQVDALDEERGGAGWEGRVIAYCIGAEAAKRARERGWRWVEELAQEVDGAELVGHIGRRCVAAA